MSLEFETVDMTNAGRDRHPAALDRLISAIEVTLFAFTEFYVSAGWRLRLGEYKLPGLYYVLAGEGCLVVGGERPILLKPNLLAVVPPGHACTIEGPGGVGIRSVERTTDINIRLCEWPDTAVRALAGEDEPRLVMLCGHVRAALGGAVALFPRSTTPIVEQFSPEDGLDQAVRRVHAETTTPRVGVPSMTGALLKQVVVTLLRHSLASNGLWTERLTALSDPRLGCAFSAMLSDPAAGHTVKTLAQIAGLSRSTFMARFAQTFDRSPMVVLRELRLARAAAHLSSAESSVEEAARVAGYSSRSSFSRAFRRHYGRDPSSTLLPPLRGADRS